jgi:hypothetical protein
VKTFNNFRAHIQPQKFLKKLIVLLLLTAFTFSQSVTYQENDQQLYSFQLNDGTKIIGYLYDENDNEIVIQNLDMEILTYSKEILVNIYQVEGIVKNGKLFRKDPNSSVYLFAPSAFPITKAKGFCRDFCLFFPSVNYGLTKHISIQGGLFWYPGMDIKSTPYVGNLKINLFHTKRFALAGGLMYVNFPATSKDKIYGAGFGFVTGTIGNEYSHASLSSGWGYIQSEEGWEVMEEPIVVLAGNLRITSFMALVTENWFYPQVDLDDSLLTISARFFGQQIALDLGAIFSINSLQDNQTPIPLINITYHYN